MNIKIGDIVHSCKIGVEIETINIKHINIYKVIDNSCNKYKLKILQSGIDNSYYVGEVVLRKFDFFLQSNVKIISQKCNKCIKGSV